MIGNADSATTKTPRSIGGNSSASGGTKTDRFLRKPVNAADSSLPSHQKAALWPERTWTTLLSASNACGWPSASPVIRTTRSKARGSLPTSCLGVATRRSSAPQPTLLKRLTRELKAHLWLLNNTQAFSVIIKQPILVGLHQLAINGFSFSISHREKKCVGHGFITVACNKLLNISHSLCSFACCPTPKFVSFCGLAAARVAKAGTRRHNGAFPARSFQLRLGLIATTLTSPSSEFNVMRAAPWGGP